MRRWLSLIERLHAGIDYDDAGCWIWKGACTKAGYGVIYGEGRKHYVHRLVYECLVGPIPAGLELDHVKVRGCMSTACCRPHHLEAVTHKINMDRGVETSAWKNHQEIQTHCSRGHEFTKANTYRAPGSPYRWCVQCRRIGARKRIADTQSD